MGAKKDHISRAKGDLFTSASGAGCIKTHMCTLWLWCACSHVLIYYHQTLPHINTCITMYVHYNFCHRHQWLHIVYMHLWSSMHMHSNVSTTTYIMYIIIYISTPKVPDSFQFQVERSHTLSNWDAIRKEFSSSTRRTCFLRSSAATQKKCRRRKRQFQKIALVAMSTWTGTYPCHTRKQSLPNKMFEEFRCFWATIRIVYSESIMKVFPVAFNACFGVKTCLLHRAPCQLLIETYGLDVNHKDGNGQTCSSTAISMPSL